MVNLTDQNFEEEVTKADLPVFVDYYADWCGPCQMAAPVIDGLAKEYEGKIKFGKVNIDENQESAIRSGVMSIPTVIIFKAGKEVSRQVGFPGKAGYEEMIKKVV